MSGGDIAIGLWEQIRLFVLWVAVLSSLHYFNEPPTSNATTITTTTTTAAAAAATTTIVLHTISQLFYILEIGLEGAAFLYSQGVQPAGSYFTMWFNDVSLHICIMLIVFQ